jgi:hypothetical protein
MAAYWICCLGVIAVGLDRLYPSWRNGAEARFEQAAERLSTSAPQVAVTFGRAFPNCSAAHAAGVYNIPMGTPAYRERQDGDGDGFACEPAPGSERW